MDEAKNNGLLGISPFPHSIKMHQFTLIYMLQVHATGTT